MIYNLSNPLHRKQFAKRANQLLKNRSTRIELTDSSNRTLNQNSYLHVLIRILAIETGVSESYSKDVYFKTLANHDIFERSEANPITGEEVRVLRSTSSLSMHEMSQAIHNFVTWAASNGYYLPEAVDYSAKNITFSSEHDRKAFENAEIETERLRIFTDSNP